MEIMETIGQLLVLGIIFLIDKPKLEATENKKYSAVYYGILSAAFLLGVLVTFKIVPEFDDMLIDFYKSMGGK